MKEEKKNYLSEVVLRLAVETKKQVLFGEVYHSILLFYPELIEADAKFKEDLKEIINKINKIPYAEQVKLLEKNYKTSKTYKPEKINLNKKIPSAESYIRTFVTNKELIGLATKLKPLGVKTINAEFSPHSPLLDGQRLFNSYYMLLKDKKLGEDLGLMRGIYDNRKELIQHRGSYNVTLYGDGMPMAQFKVISCLIEHGQEIVNFFHGLTIDMSGEDGFMKYLRALHSSMANLGITQVIPTQYPSNKFRVTEVKTDYSFA